MLAEKTRATPEQTRRLPQLHAPGLYTVALVAVLGAILIVALAPRLDTDLWWHLKVGAYIAVHHAVPSHDFLSFTSRGRPWTDHEWLAELTLYSLYRLMGLWGPIVLFALVICAAFGLVYWQMAERGINRILALFLIFGGFLAASPAIGARPQMLSLLFLALYSLLLYRFEVTRSRRLLLLFPLLMLLWTNLHGGFVLGLVVLVLTLCGEWLNRLTRHPGAYSQEDLQVLGLALLATIAVTMVNPNGVRELIYPFVWIFPTAYSNSLTEWVSTDFHMPQMMVFEAMLLMLIGAVVVGRQRPNWCHLLLILVFTHLALSQVRNVSVWCVLIVPLLGLYLQAATPALREQFPAVSYRRRPVSGRLAPFLNTTLLLMVAVVYLVEVVHYVNPKALRQNESDVFPASAVAYMARHPLPPHVYNAYAWGGYLLWKLSPRYQDFIDGRANTLFSSTLLNDYFNIYAAAPNWRRLLNQYRVQTVLVEPGAPIVQALSEDPRWRTVYKGGNATILVRRDWRRFS